MKLLLLFIVIPCWAAEDGYVDPVSCRSCHREIYDNFRQTGMGRSFAKVAEVPPLTSFQHVASSQQFSIVKRGDAFALRRSSPPFEKTMDFAIGSGEHSRTYAHRDSRGKLFELPVSWYSEDGGSWHMSPGYDRQDHSGFRREISDSCLFCHNGYPSKANGGLAEGIDCQRCHGPGEAHALRKGTIVNPAKLATERGFEVCLQCHLESASRTLPESIQRFGGTPFSYRPGEPLGNFRLFFEYANPSSEERITVNGSAYALMKSACFLRSSGRLQCTTCHDPHRQLTVAEVETHYTRACRSCHAREHEASTRDCAGCHMQKRRTEDAVHVVMTDHFIRKFPLAGNQLAMIPERHDRWSGPVKIFYPGSLPDTPERQLYLAMANGDAAGIKRAIDLTEPRHAEPYYAMADAVRKTGQTQQAIVALQRAVEFAPKDKRAYIAAAELMQGKGAIDLIDRALALMPDDTQLLNTSAVMYAGIQNFEKALTQLSRAIAIDSDDALTWLNLGVCLEAKGDVEGAESAYRQALIIDPASVRARAYLKRFDGAISRPPE